MNRSMIKEFLIEKILSIFEVFFWYNAFLSLNLVQMLKKRLSWVIIILNYELDNL